MTYSGAILRRWQEVDILPGGFIVFLNADPSDSIRARMSGLQLKDTLLVLGPEKVTMALLFRRPLEGILLENILQHGTGALHIDATRVRADLSEFFSATGKPRSGMGHAKGYGMGDGYGGENANPPNAAGRWPTNTVFVHQEGCRLVGSRKVTTGVAHRTRSGGKTFGGSVDKPPMGDMTYAEEDGKETIPSYACDPQCFVHLLDQQSGERPSTFTGRANPSVAHEHPSSAKTKSWFSGGAAKESQVYADFGSASRFYPSFRNREALLIWIRTLISRDGNVFERF